MFTWISAVLKLKQVKYFNHKQLRMGPRHTESPIILLFLSGGRWPLSLRGELKRMRKEKVLVTQSCPTLCDPIHYNLTGSSVHGILRARILK